MAFTRRNFLLTSLLLPAVLMAAPAALARNVTMYTPELLPDFQQTGQPYLLDFAATWCTTCKAQERVLDALQSGNPAYNAIPIVRVDWDTYRTGDLVAELQIPRRSTLVLMNGTSEIGRIVAQTGRDQIAGLLDLAL